jgi:ABC-2 type transport system ATP-binding protein
MQVKHYSSGMYARLAFAVAVNIDPDILLVDEVLSVGDEAFQRKCLNRVKEFQKEGRTILLVTHAADLVRQICDRAAVLDHGELVTFGNPGDSVRIFRETLLHRGIEIPPEAAPTVDEIITGDITMRSISVEYPVTDRSYVLPNEPLRLRIAYEARVPNADVVLGLQVHDQDGNLMLGTDTDLLGYDMGKVDGAGEVVVDFERMPLQGGIYPLTLQLRSRDGGVVYDQRDQLDRFEVMQPQRIEGRVHFDVAATGTTHAPAAVPTERGNDTETDTSVPTGT